MPFSMASWTVVGKPTTPKRARSDSGIGFSMPISKRIKRSLSDGDKDEVVLALGSSNKQELSENLGRPGAQAVYRLPPHPHEPTQDTPMIDTFLDTASANLENSRQASEALSAYSGATAVASDPATDVKTDEFEDLFKQDLTVIGTEVDQSNEPKIPINTFEKFGEFPPELRIDVFEQAEILCPVGQCFKPFYKQGMLKGYILNKQLNSKEVNADSETSKAYIMNDNVDFLAPAFVTKQYAKVYIEAFYSHNEFSFNDPRAAMWFFKRLGHKFQYLRKIELVMTGGLAHQTYDSSIDYCTETLEELWWGVICWIEHRHKLQCLSLIFKWSRTEYGLRNFDKVDDDKIAEMMLLRQKIVCRLGRSWGIKCVKIEDKSKGFFENPEDILDAQLAMQQTGIDAPVQDKRKTPFTEVLELSKARLEPIDDLGSLYLSDCDESKLAIGEDQNDVYEESLSHKTTSGRMNNIVTDSRSAYWTSEVQGEDQHQKQKKGKAKSEAKAAQDSITTQLVAHSKVQQSQPQPSRLSTIVNSIGNNKSASTTSRPTTSGTINPSQFYGSAPQQRHSSGRVDDVRLDNDRPISSGRRPSNASYGNGRKRKNKHYGARRYQFQGYDE